MIWKPDIIKKFAGNGHLSIRVLHLFSSSSPVGKYLLVSCVKSSFIPVQQYEYSFLGPTLPSSHKSFFSILLYLLHLTLYSGHLYSTVITVFWEIFLYQFTENFHLASEVFFPDRSKPDFLLVMLPLNITAFQCLGGWKPIPNNCWSRKLSVCLAKHDLLVQGLKLPQLFSFAPFLFFSPAPF